MKLSPHFTLEEFTRSSTALRQGIVNVPSERHVLNLTRLCLEVLEPMRERLVAELSGELGAGVGIRITSGYRCPGLNTAIGGAKTSAHMDGRAADFEVIGGAVDLVEVFEFLRRQPLPFDQIIQECGPSGWIHIGIAPDGVPPRGEMLTATGSPGAWKYERVA